MLSLLKKFYLYIFGTFNSANIDTLVMFRNNYTNSTWEKGSQILFNKNYFKISEKKKLSLNLKNLFFSIKFKKKITNY